ncbi:MAG: PEP-CTERM sorting domain-containing protein [Opitutales bacterium]
MNLIATAPHLLRLLLIGLALTLAAHGQTSYTITNLTTLANTATLVVPYAINNSGQVTGREVVGGYNHVFLYGNGAMLDLGTAGGPGTGSVGTGINNSGSIVGFLSNSYSSGILYSGGVLSDLGHFGGTQAELFGINDSGVIVGNLYTTGASAALIGGAVPGIGNLGGNYVNAVAINNSGWVAGSSSITTGVNPQYHAYLYNGTATIDLGTLVPGGTSSASALNNAGTVVGYSDGNGFIYSNGVMTMIDSLPAANGGDPLAINNLGQVVGVSGSHAFLYGASTGTLDLNSLVTGYPGWVLQEAVGINDSGQIVGYGTVYGAQAAFLLTPTAVPEPATTAALGGMASLLVAWFRLRRR